MDRKTMGILAVAMVAAIALAPLAFEAGVAPEDSLYRVAGDRSGAVAPAVDFDDRIAWANEAPIIATSDAVSIEKRGPASDATLDALATAYLRWTDHELQKEMDQAAAFPLQVQVNYNFRVAPEFAVQGGQTETTPAPQNPTSNATGSTGDEVQAPPPTTTGPVIRPGEVEPPFPMRSVILVFAFLIPMNFVAQLQAGSLLGDRTRRRGLLLLTIPARPSSVLLGRVAPYLGLSLLVWLVAGVIVKTNPLGMVAALPIIFFVLAASILIGLIARNPREVTFLLTGVTTGASAFLFLPAVFTALPPVAYLSPVSVVAAGIRGEVVPWPAFMYATMPLTLMSLGMVAIAFGLYREESLFAPRGLLQKATESLARFVTTKKRLAVATFAVLPWVFVLELSWLAFVIPLGLWILMPLVVIGAGFIEEAFKAWIGNRYATKSTPWITGLVVGVSFFVAEKMAFVLILVQYPQLPASETTLGLFGIGGWAIAALPLVVHVVGATIGCMWANRGAKNRRVAWLLAGLFHAAYNGAMVVFGGMG